MQRVGVRRSIAWLVSVAATIVFVTYTRAQTKPDEISGRGAPLFNDLGDHQHPISTKSAEAQKYFNQGLILTYGFNHGEAVRSFQRAAELDPALAMAHWGVALALGPNINATMEPAAHKQAWEALQAAMRLKPGASPRERDYIDALAVRYVADPKADTAPLQHKYADAMRKLAAKYADDLDAQTLFAESLMNLYPWKLWTLDGKPAPVTLEAVRTLESVLERVRCRDESSVALEQPLVAAAEHADHEIRDGAEHGGRVLGQR